MSPEEARIRGIHHVDGRDMPCCEVGETDCPCVCHEPAQRCGCGNLMTPRPDGGCSCMCHPANQAHEDARILRMVGEAR